MILYICEKPAQAVDIARNLNVTTRHDGYLEGNGYQFTWCVGHLLELAPPEYYRKDIKPWRLQKLPIIPEKWELLVTSRTKKQFNVIQSLLKKTKHVVIATDPDREGQAIAEEVLEKCGYKGKTERLWLSALDNVSIQKALKNIKPNNEMNGLYQAARSRSAADWLLGMNNTMAVTALYGINEVLSVGRVQTPTLKLVVDRDREIESFESQDYFILKALFSTTDQSEFWTICKIPGEVLNSNGYCLDKKLVENIVAQLNDESGIVRCFKEINKKEKPPLCFSLSTLQKKSSRIFGYSAKKTLEIAQSLYEIHKATTYPRTDSEYLPEEQLGEVESILNAIVQSDYKLKYLVDACDPYFRSLVWNNKKIKAHHAIIPTSNNYVDIKKMSEHEFKVYDLIRRQYLAQFLGDYGYIQRQVEVICTDQLFTVTTNIPIQSGWKKAVTQKTSINKEDQDYLNEMVPNLKENDLLKKKEVKIETKKTKPKSRFTDGTLIDAMKTVGKLVENESLKKILKNNSGIGTEATRANILETLFKRGYLERQSKQVISTKKGRILVDPVPRLMRDPILTAEWEQKLEKMTKGEGDFKTFIDSQIKLLYEMLNKLKNENQDERCYEIKRQLGGMGNNNFVCPKCQFNLRRIKNKSGAYFWGCCQYPNCNFTAQEKNGKPNL